MARQERSLNRRIAEALPKDVGRAIARLDPTDMEDVGVAIGDTLEIMGKRSAAVKAMPTYPEDRGKGIVQIDGIARDNAQVGLDEQARLRRVEPRPARAIYLKPLRHFRKRANGEFGDYLARLLETTPMRAGDRVRVNLFGARPQEFQVLETSPAQAVVVVTPSTTIRIKGEVSVPGRAKISYEDIGGLGREVSRIREMIELPLRCPEVFETLGMEPPKGVLLHGPPGCGKTLIARAVAHETSAYFIPVNGPEIMHKFYGESEAHLRQIFQDAQAHLPSIVFIDEIDAIAPKRADLGDEKQVERRVVAQLLALMDGLQSRGRLIVIGATNIPDNLDPALRRPGRFDREITIPVPNENGRREILEIHTRGMPLAADVDVKRLAGITHGFVGADLEALCREAAMNALRLLIPDIDLERGEIPYEKLEKLEVTADHFLQALTEVEPSAIREFFTEIPDVCWGEVGGLDKVKQILKESVEWPLKYAPLFDHAKTKPPKGILLAGPPGTGKTLTAKAAARESGANFISVKGPALLSKWIGESEKAVREIFRKAKQTAPCIIFLDEIDSIAPIRSGADSSHTSERVVSQLLSEMDGIEELRGVLILAATNRLDMIDPALLRPGRFDVIIELPVPDLQARVSILEVHAQGKPLAEDVDLHRLARDAEGLVGADLEFLCRQASLLAIREFVEEGRSNSDYDSLRIEMRHFQQALALLTEGRPV